MFWTILKGWFYLGLMLLGIACLIGGFMIGTAGAGALGMLLCIGFIIAGLLGSHG